MLPGGIFARSFRKNRISVQCRITGIFADVHDTSGMYKNEDGTPYQYTGHWSWPYFFNNECVDDTTGENLWTWLGRQSK